MLTHADSPKAPSVALKETCRIVKGRIPLLDLHIERLRSGGCGEQLLERVRKEMNDAASDHGAFERRRLLVVVNTVGAIRTSVDDTPSTIDIEGGPTYKLVFMTGPPQLPPNAAKPADRSVWDTALAEARQEGCDQAVLVDSDGAVIDGSTANLWAVWADRAFTPPAPPAIAGIARRLLLDRGREAGLRPEVAHLRAADLRNADEIFFTTAVAGARAASGHGGPVSKKAQEWFERVYAGQA